MIVYGEKNPSGKEIRGSSRHLSTHEGERCKALKSASEVLSRVEPTMTPGRHTMVTTTAYVISSGNHQIATRSSTGSQRPSVSVTPNVS
jgi:endonuclease V-like protein UPF0215 family